MESDWSNVNDTALLLRPFLTTVTEPEVAPEGTVTPMLVSLHEDTVAESELNKA